MDQTLLEATLHEQDVDLLGSEMVSVSAAFEVAGRVIMEPQELLIEYRLMVDNITQKRIFGETLDHVNDPNNIFQVNLQYRKKYN